MIAMQKRLFEILQRQNKQLEYCLREDRGIMRNSLVWIKRAAGKGSRLLRWEADAKTKGCVHVILFLKGRYVTAFGESGSRDEALAPDGPVNGFKTLEEAKAWAAR